MISMKFDMYTARKAAKEEPREEGMQQGIKKGVCKLHRRRGQHHPADAEKGMRFADSASITEWPAARIIEIAKKNNLSVPE